MSLAIGAVDDRDWDEFCAASPSAWLWHTTAWREYTLNYRPELQSESRAFGVYDEGRLVAVVPLMIERDEDGWAFTFGGAACWSPATRGTWRSSSTAGPG